MAMSREWKVETADNPTLLEHTLQELQDQRWTIWQVLTEGPSDGFCYTIIAFKVTA